MAMVKPLHLCHCNASASYPPSLERNRPASEVNEAVNAESNKNHSPARRIVSFVFFLLSMNITHSTYITNNTIGKCNNRGCIRPATCSQAGITILLSKRRKNNKRQLMAKQQLNKIFRTALSITQQGLVCRAVLFLSSTAPHTYFRHRP